MKWIQLSIYGVVQGIGFRNFIKNKAKLLGIKGYVKNEFDGSVTVVAGGNDSQLESLKEYIKTGNGYSVVYKMFEKEIPPQTFVDFFILY
ncbi:MAG: acylphosphatase [Thermosipho sp. (in: Bacteria)]|nr:acylphosphatase [Thermosipho sp. (in: thermotogales)]